MTCPVEHDLNSHDSELHNQNLHFEGENTDRVVWTVILLVAMYGIIGTVLMHQRRMGTGHGVFWILFLAALAVSVSLVALYGACFFYYLALGISLLLMLYWILSEDNWAVVANFIAAVLLITLTYRYHPLAAVILLVYPIWMLYAFI